MNVLKIILFCLSVVISSAYASGSDIANIKTKAERGDAKAQFNLAMIYDEGLGVKENDAKAAHWYRKAAAQGNAFAQAFLGTMYARGEGVPMNHTIAYAWLILASAQGIDEVTESLDFLSEKMTPDEMEQARELSVKYQNQYAPASSN